MEGGIFCTDYEKHIPDGYMPGPHRALREKSENQNIQKGNARRNRTMTVYEELVARGLMAQRTDEEGGAELVNDGKATF